MTKPAADQRGPALIGEEGRDKILAFWFFIGAEVVLFGGLFGVYLASKGHIGNGPGPMELFELRSTALSTACLLTSSLTCALALSSLREGKRGRTWVFLALTLLLGTGFLALEVREFARYAAEGHTLTVSPFLSSLYLLVGTHGSHVAFGCLWMALLFVHLAREGIGPYTAPKVEVFSLYWHFVDVVWIFIFTIVYLLGKAGAG